VTPHGAAGLVGRRAGLAAMAGALLAGALACGALPGSGRPGLLAGQPRDRALGEIGGDLDLAREREHVGIEPGVQEHRGLDLLRGRMGRGLV